MAIGGADRSHSPNPAGCSVADRLLYPPLRTGADDGSVSQSDLLLYAWRDVRGVEAPAAAPADRTGYNEEAEWTERAELALRREHRADGTHGGPKHPLAWIGITIEAQRVPGSGTIAVPVLHDNSRFAYGPPHSEAAIGEVYEKSIGEYIVELYTNIPPVSCVPEANGPVEITQLSDAEIEVVTLFYDPDTGNRIRLDVALTIFPIE
jgi:hypothetical protein